MRFRSCPESHDAFATGVKTGLYFHMFLLWGGGRWDAVGWGVLTFMRTALIDTHTLLGYVGWGWVGRVNFHMN